MSIGRRAYDITRGYINREWDRIQGLERNYAEQELKDSMDQPAPAKSVETPSETSAPFDKQKRARELLGVSETATFKEIRKTFERLNKRSDPSKFPAGSEEAAQAAKIQQRVNWAYQALTENVDITEKRFQSLEIE